MIYKIAAITALVSVISINAADTPTIAPYIKTPITLEERAGRTWDVRRGLYTECEGYDGDWTKGGLPEHGKCVGGMWIPPMEAPIFGLDEPVFVMPYDPRDPTNPDNKFHPVPVPGTLWLMLIGFIGVIIRAIK